MGLRAGVTEEAWALLSNRVRLELGTDGYHSAAWSRHAENLNEGEPVQAGGITEGIVGEADLHSRSLGDQVQASGGGGAVIQAKAAKEPRQGSVGESRRATREMQPQGKVRGDGGGRGTVLDVHRRCL